MKKYKLVKDLPWLSRGSIFFLDIKKEYIKDRISYLPTVLGMKCERFAINPDWVENNPEWFVKYQFTTEDNVDIYTGDYGCYILKSNTIYYFNWVESSSQLKGAIYFSSEEKAQEYLDSLKVPKWVICIREKRGFLGNLNMVYEVLKYENGSYYFDISKAIGEDLVREATKAEVEAHKLGFHIGNKVWVTVVIK